MIFPTCVSDVYDCTHECKNVHGDLKMKNAANKKRNDVFHLFEVIVGDKLSPGCKNYNRATPIGNILGIIFMIVFIHHE